MRNEIVKNNLHFQGVVARGAVLNYESGILCEGGFKNRGGGLGSGPLLARPQMEGGGAPGDIKGFSARTHLIMARLFLFMPLLQCKSRL